MDVTDLKNAITHDNYFAPLSNKDKNLETVR